MSREIKFRAFNYDDQKMYDWDTMCNAKGVGIWQWLGNETANEYNAIMQYTGLKDKKKDLTEVYEGDIIGKNGLVKGNRHENPDLLEDETNLLIKGIGTKDWVATYKEAVVRGCYDAE